MKLIASVVLAIAALGIFSSEAFAADRLLTCGSGANKIVIGACGSAGCAATVTTNGKKKSYNFKRTKGDDGSLTYKSTCTTKIGAISNGVRKVKSSTCNTALKDKTCNIQ